MIIGIPREVKESENRVGMTPAGVHELTKAGHTLLIQKDAGKGSGFSDGEYTAEGGQILGKAEEIFNAAEMIIKVKEPQKEEIPLLKEGQILFTYLHLAADKELTVSLLERKIIGIAYETVEKNHRLILLEPMSEIAGKMSSLMGAYYLAKPYGGKGILAGGIAGVHSANWLILGAGTAGLNAAKVAAGMGARVIVMDINLERLRYLEDILPSNCEMLMSNRINIERELPYVDVIIGAVLIPGGKAPYLITRDMLKLMKPGTVMVDISVDQGGCMETSRPTSHLNPTFEEEGILHYCVSNMPGAYPRSSTFALTNSTLPLAGTIASEGWEKAARNSSVIAGGINMVKGTLTYRKVAEAHNLPFTPLEKLLL